MSRKGIFIIGDVQYPAGEAYEQSAREDMFQQDVGLGGLQRVFPNNVVLYLCNPLKTIPEPELGLFGY